MNGHGLGVGKPRHDPPFHQRKAVGRRRRSLRRFIGVLRPVLDAAFKETVGFKTAQNHPVETLGDDAVNVGPGVAGAQPLPGKLP